MYSVVEHVHVNDRDRCQKEFQKRLTGNPSKYCTIRLLCQDQSILWFNLKSLTDPKSHLLYVLAVDTTQEKKAQSLNKMPDPKLVLDHLREGVFISTKQKNLLNQFRPRRFLPQPPCALLIVRGSMLLP